MIPTHETFDLVGRRFVSTNTDSALAEHPTSYGFGRSVEAVKEAVPLTQYARQIADLNRSGELLVGLCPLPDHDERTPSFTVYPDGHWWCFGCLRGGDVLDLHQLVHGYAEKWEALVSLARDQGVEPPAWSEGRKNR